MLLSEEKLNRRKLRQFVLRALLPVATFCSGWIANEWYREREMHQADATINAAKV
jgi:hypothetical protein